ncbi:hypothetical protein BpHYR1_009321 [Brachionus plicatilis]|uniref:Uncharacterized protein n=1 Tax=Brachionus plicatilis TaxID=10195 RepID=A0A3M7SZU3_BRAPC|nr:hypothetical protein BpHYR1_009321 [Brachionus plicatilis]
MFSHYLLFDGGSIRLSLFLKERHYDIIELISTEFVDRYYLCSFFNYISTLIFLQFQSRLSL